ncbi:MAG TPA: helix-turn-helix transcriptional regulator [Spirochaetota bacterium]|nr:helix-turn-helix transcriptional regulator [Spirochaetota bacterium]HPS88282.1 helix-turn-helix transcriptional regulator [Spirochaetota bacterium]
MNIGTYLKHLRLEKGYTLNEVAHILNMSASVLSQLENMKHSSSLESFEKILSYYAVNLSDFFRQIEQKRFIIVRYGDENPFEMSEGGIQLTPLASKLQNNSLELTAGDLINYKSYVPCKSTLLKVTKLLFLFRGCLP